MIVELFNVVAPILDGRGALRSAPCSRFAGFSRKDALIGYRTCALFWNQLNCSSVASEIYTEEEIRARRHLRWLRSPRL
jgi:hypothetical protein